MLGKDIALCGNQAVIGPDAGLKKKEKENLNFDLICQLCFLECAAIYFDKS